MEREEMSVSSFIRQNNRRGQVSERSLPRTISLLLLLLLVINPIIRDMRTTRQREINYTVRCTVWSSHESQRPKHLFIQKCCHYVGDNTQTPSGNGQEIFLFLFTSLQGYPVIWLAVRYGVHLAQRNQIRETGFRQHTGALLLAHTPDADQLLLLPREEDLMWPQMFLYYYWPHDSVISLPVFLTWLKLLAPS